MQQEVEGRSSQRDVAREAGREARGPCGKRKEMRTRAEGLESGADLRRREESLRAREGRATGRCDLCVTGVPAQRREGRGEELYQELTSGSFSNLKKRQITQIQNPHEFQIERPQRNVWDDTE